MKNYFIFFLLFNWCFLIKWLDLIFPNNRFVKSNVKISNKKQNNLVICLLEKKILQVREIKINLKHGIKIDKIQ